MTYSAKLERGAAASVPLAFIVAMADADHPAADHALHTYTHAAIDADRFNDLPLQVRASAQRALTRPSLPPGYSSNQAQVVNERIELAERIQAGRRTPILLGRFGRAFP
jgi:hypothetical protein